MASQIQSQTKQSQTRQIGTRQSQTTQSLRFITAGSVDDGKSTLIGRLLYDSKCLLQDQLQALRKGSDGDFNFASVTDGLRAEREQGITIDVAYRYFSTPRRKFIAADTPGHIQYARNMVTAASTASLALILVDATSGVSEQTRRHAYFAYLLGIKHVVICVNKMDLVDFSQAAFEAIRSRFAELEDVLKFATIDFIPVSALHGENLVEPSDKFPWYVGPPLLRFLEDIEVHDVPASAARFPVQWIVKGNGQTGACEKFRGYAGQIYSGQFQAGEEVIVLPSGLRTRIKAIHTYDGQLESARSPLSVTLLLDDDLDVGRGDLLVPANAQPRIDSKLTAVVCWMQNQPLQIGKFYEIKHATKTSRVKVVDVHSRLDLATLSQTENADKRLKLNEIGTVSLVATTAIAYDCYAENRLTGSFVIIDDETHATAGAGLLIDPLAAQLSSRAPGQP